MPIDKAELFDIYHEAFPKIMDIIQNSWLTEAGRYRQIEEIANEAQKKIDEKDADTGRACSHCGSPEGQPCRDWLVCNLTGTTRR